MKIAVTGGAGFIGSHAVDRLLKDGHSVLSLDDFTLGTEKHFEHNLSDPRFKFVELDVTEQNKLNDEFKKFKPDCVFCLAANSDIQAGAYDANVDYKKTFLTTISTLNAARNSSVKEFIFASSSTVYGERPGLISENTGPLIPESNYGAAKLASEAFIYSSAYTNNMNVWTFRFPNVCGPRATHGVFVNFLRFLRKDPTRLEVARDGTQAKPYTHVLDLVDAIMLGWSMGKEKINIFNVGNAPLVSVNEIMDFLLKEKGISKSNIKIIYTGKPAWPGDIKTYSFDYSKIRSLGYKPKWNSLEAVQETARTLVHDPEASIAI